MALAYFLTFTTYGTWLHGSAKGKGSVDRAHNDYGTPFVTPDSRREMRAVQAMKHPPYLMDAASRQVVRDAILGLCVEKGWTPLAVHVRANHIHVVMCADREAGRLLSDLKARASRDLTRAGEDPNRPRRTRHGSTRHLFTPSSVASAVAYTLDAQGDRMAWFDGRNPAPDPPTKEPRTK